MARKQLNWYEGGIYHITNRGNRKEEIFRDGDDYKFFVELMKEGLNYFEEKSFEIISYCLMTNHIHILIKANTLPPGDYMHRVSMKYSKYFNNKYNYVGHLFQARYKFEATKNDVQLLLTSRYIHLNPVKAKIVEKAEHYCWSNYRVFIGKEKEKFTASEIVLRNISEKNSAQKYRALIEENKFNL